MLASKGCPAYKAGEIANEIINIAGYLNLMNHRRILLKEQQETIKPKDDE